jgi:DNA polymerase
MLREMNDRTTVDFETRSASDLKKEGAYKYSLHPTTKPTCFSFKPANSPIRLLKFHEINRHWCHHDETFRKAWTHLIKTSLFSAHNAFFEICIYKNIMVRRYGWPDIDFRNWRCTAAKAAACALPRSLEGSGGALELKVQKDKSGHAAVMATCKPTRQWVAWKKKGGIGVEPPKFLEPEAAPEMWTKLYRYNCIDTLAEEELDKTLPDLSPLEQEIWFLNVQLNWRGIRVDIPIVKKIIALMELEEKTRLKELDSLTMGLVTKPGARQSILDFLAAEGVRLSDVKKKTIEDALNNFNLSVDAKRLLELRQLLSKTSTKKYQAFINRANLDDRVRDILMYHGASTGRDSGTGVQFQNLPKPLIKQKEIESVLDILASSSALDGDMEWIKCLYGDPGIVFSSLIRSMLIPSAGKELFVADFSKIEVCVLWWLADNKPGLRVLKAGKDPYKYQAAANTNKRYEEIADDGNERQLGKAQTLGCGYGMGWQRFLESAWDMYRLKLTEQQARFAVSAYRESNPAVPLLWKNYERAAIAAVEEKKIVKINKCAFHCDRGFLWITLPSGRRLAYRNPSIGMRENDWGPQKTLEYWGVNPKTKKWAKEVTWGGKIVENVVQAGARDVMYYPLPKLEKLGYQVLLTVHDEVVAEREIDKGSVKEYCSILCAKPLWADENLILEAKGWKGPRYRK